MGFILPFLLLALAALLLWLSTRHRRGLGLPEGRLLYEDSGGQRRLREPLFAEDLDLMGRPDYLIKSKQGLIPVEVKTGRSPKQPFESHVFQLAAYCVLVERNFKQRPPFGIIKYPQASYQVDFTENLENQLLGLLADMRLGFMSGELHRSHSAAARCRSCGYVQLCPERL